MKNEIKYGYNDINIVPEISSNIKHRFECYLEPFLFAAPMSSVVDLDNIPIFTEQGVTSVIPRNIDINHRKTYINYQDLKLKPFCN